ncbi:MAG TPA: hypothetical protein VME70_14890 [Mycobacteriales bacterium]|nr:hypothetical protein [Mycobacteriales bacterium]
MGVLRAARRSSRIGAASAAATVAFALALTGSGTSEAASHDPSTAAPITHHVTGEIDAVSCLTAHRCVAVGNTKVDGGEYVVVENGVPGKLRKVGTSGSLEAISCAGAAGCVALAQSITKPGPLLITFGRGGKPIRRAIPSVPANVSMSGISCTAVKHCILVGYDLEAQPNKLYVGVWNGHSISEHRVHGLKKNQDVDNVLVSCHGSHCLLVGAAEGATSVAGITVPIHDGHPGHLVRLSGDEFSAVECVSATRCYATANRDSNPVIVTLSHGKKAAVASTTGTLYGIACSGNACTAVGITNPPPSAHEPYDVGLVVKLSAGVITGTQTVAASKTYVGVARPGPHHALAVGPAQKKGSVTSLL